MKAWRTASKAWLLVGVALAGCGGGGGDAPGPHGPPSISALRYSPTWIPVTQAGDFVVSGTLDFEDSGGDVAELSLTITDVKGSPVSTVTQAIAGAGGLRSGSLTGALQANVTAAGVYTIHVTVVDRAGSRSNELTGLFEIVPVDTQAPVLATTGPGPASLTSADGQLYWTEAGTAAIRRASTDGGGVATLATRVVNMQAAAFVGTDVIWEDDRAIGLGACGSNTVVRVISRTTSGGITTELASGDACGGGTSDLAVLGNKVYWVSSPGASATYRLNATPLAGGPSVVVSQGSAPIVALVAGTSALYWFENRFATSVGAIRSVVAADGVVSTLASGFDSASDAMTVDDTNVYFTTPNYPRVSPPFTETLVAQPLAGGPSRVVAGAVPTPIRLATAAATVLWSAAGGVHCVPATGGAVTQLAVTTATPFDLALIGSRVVWSESERDANGSSHQHGAIRSVPLSGGSVALVYQGEDAPQRLVLDGSARLNWIERGADDASDGGSRLARLASANVAQTVLSGIASAAPSIVVTGTDLYIADRQRIKRLPVAGGMPESVVAAAPEQAPMALAVDATRLYWSGPQRGAAFSAPHAGGPVSVVAPGDPNLGAGGAVHLGRDGRVYWATHQAVPVESDFLVGAPKTGGSAQVVTRNGPHGDFALAGDRAFFVDSSSHDLVSQPLAGGPGSPQGSGGLNLAAGDPLAWDGANLFILSDQIVRIGVSDVTAMPVLDFVDRPSPGSSLAVDGAKVYWTDPSARRIRSSAK